MVHTLSVTRASQQLMLSIAASGDEHQMQYWDFFQAYTQSKLNLAHKVLTHTLRVSGYPPNFLFIFVLSIYVLSKLC